MAINQFIDNRGITGSVNRNGTLYTSVINITGGINRFCTSDAYFASGAQFFRVDLIYGETSEARQSKRIQHYGHYTNMRGNVSWTSEAKNGRWHLNQIKLFDHDGATKTINRSVFGATADVTVNL